MNLRRFAAALREALRTTPETVRHTVTIEAVRGVRGGPFTITVDIEDVTADGQSVHRVGGAREHDGLRSPYTEAVWGAVDDDPDERHQSDVLAWMARRADDAAHGVPLVPRR